MINSWDEWNEDFEDNIENALVEESLKEINPDDIVTPEQEEKVNHNFISDTLDSIATNKYSIGTAIASSVQEALNKPTVLDGGLPKTNRHIVYSKGMYNSLTKKRGSKATRNNNPGNITGAGGKLLYGAIAFASSSVGDAGDRNQLVFKTEEDGFKAMHKLAMKNYNSAPIKTAFSKWQSDKASFRNKLKSLVKNGIDINKKYGDLTPEQQKTFRGVWARYEGYKGTVY